MDIRSVLDLSGRAAVVTGAGSGLGRKCAEFLAAAGAQVVCGDIDEQAAAETAKLIGDDGGVATSAALDVTDRASVEQLFDLALESYGRLDIAVNSAGVIRYHAALDITEEEFDGVMDVNLKGVLFSCQSAARRMPDGGSIINIASAIIDRLRDGATAYAASKGGVAQVTRTFAFELGERGVRVNAIAPGWVETGMTTQLFTDESGEIDPERREQILAARASGSPLKTVGSAEDIAYMAWFLASDAARFCTGQTFRVNGGIHMV